ncbi:TBC1 domain family member 25 isoform X2 [Festucalex cinctus]
MASDEERGVVRVKVKKCDGALPVEFRSFAVDPQITSLEVLQHILIKAFDLNGRRNFEISYMSRGASVAETYPTLTSDGDLDVAFATAAKPYLQLKMDVKPSEDSPVMEDWDIISPKDVIGSEQLLAERTKSLASAALPFTQSLMSQVGRTLTRVQQAFSWSYGEEIKPFKPPLSDTEFHSYLNSQGQLTRPEELRLRIYHGGVEPSLRKVVWRYLLNVYPDGLSGQERMDYMKRKTREYDRLKKEWTAHVSHEDLEFIRGNVVKDVLRTDRAHPYYAGSEDSPHLTALADLLTTFAITHPQISYCQGMSDIASPILAVMDNEAHAFICFCGIMKRLEGNFRPDGQLMSIKFQHLKLLLQYSDDEFYSYLVSRGADDLFFCYRWLLLELKREFAFDDALRMLEVTWSSLPPDPPETDVELLGPPPQTDGRRLTDSDGGLGRDWEMKEKQRRQHMLRPLREEADVGWNAVTEVGLASERRVVTPLEETFGDFKYYTAQNEDGFDLKAAERQQCLADAQSSRVPTRQSTVDSEEDAGERTPLIKCSKTGFSPASSPPLPPIRNSDGVSQSSSALPSSRSVAAPDSAPQTTFDFASSGREALSRTVPKVITSSAQLLRSAGLNSTAKPCVTSHAHHQNRSFLSSPILPFGKSPSQAASRSSPNNLHSPSNKPATGTATHLDASPNIKPCSLPPPQEFGKGNPFMLFLCLSILLEHRDHIIKNGLDYNELAMHFDRLVRRHNLSRILQRAKALFADYLQSEVWDSEEGDETSSRNSTYNLAMTVPSPSAEVSLSHMS